MARIDYEKIYRVEVVRELENDRELDFKSKTDKYLQKGLCPSCGQRKLFASKEKPWQIKCNCDNDCQFEQKTHERYRFLFENLSERFPKTPSNPNATADAYLQRNRGFDIVQLAGWYTQATRKVDTGAWADTVRFTLCDGYWERIIDERMVAANKNHKAGIKYGMTYQNDGWMPPGQTTAYTLWRASFTPSRCTCLGSRRSPRSAASISPG